jgi:hypothetical protein
VPVAVGGCCVDADVGAGVVGSAPVAMGAGAGVGTLSPLPFCFGDASAGAGCRRQPMRCRCRCPAAQEGAPMTQARCPDSPTHCDTPPSPVILDKPLDPGPTKAARPRALSACSELPPAARAGSGSIMRSVKASEIERSESSGGVRHGGSRAG